MGTRAWVMGVTRAQWEIVLQTEAIGQLPHLFFSTKKQCRGSGSSHVSGKQLNICLTAVQTITSPKISEYLDKI
jgi:hypothetical protein